MPLLNYTTTIEAQKTVAEIQRILAAHGVKALLMEYDKSGMIEALSFKILSQHGDLAFRLPVFPDAVLKVLARQNVPRRYLDRLQAIRVAWRIVKDWVEAQMALLETEMVRLEQIFLPYMITRDGRTLYERMVSTQFQLREGSEEES